MLIEKPDISTARAEIEDGTKMSQLADELIKKAERINVDLSEFILVQSSDNISMWAFTEKIVASSFMLAAIITVLYLICLKIVNQKSQTMYTNK